MKHLKKEVTIMLSTLAVVGTVGLGVVGGNTIRTYKEEMCNLKEQVSSINLENNLLEKKLEETENKLSDAEKERNKFRTLYEKEIEPVNFNK